MTSHTRFGLFDQRYQCLFDLRLFRLQNLGASDQDHVPAIIKLSVYAPGRFPHQSFGPVAGYRVAQLPAGCHPDAGVVLVVLVIAGPDD